MEPEDLKKSVDEAIEVQKLMDEAEAKETQRILQEKAAIEAREAQLREAQGYDPDLEEPDDWDQKEGE